MRCAIGTRCVINLDCMFELVVSIAQRWPARVDALFGLLAHSLADFLAQVLDVVSGDHNLNAMHELGLRFESLPMTWPSFGR